MITSEANRNQLILKIYWQSQTGGYYSKQKPLSLA